MKWCWWILVWLIIGDAGFAGSPAALPLHGRGGRSCQAFIAEAEKKWGIPQHLLQAIALGESGRTTKKNQKQISWPWTINAQGKGKFFPSKQEAVAAVRQLQAKDVKSIDVGCMQVNLMHHPHAFRSLEEAFDPKNNVFYAAEFLSDLKEQTHSWPQAVAHYHSASAERHRPYRDRILKIWQTVQRFGLDDEEATILFPSPEPTLKGKQYANAANMPFYKGLRQRPVTPLTTKGFSPTRAIYMQNHQTMRFSQTQRKSIPINVMRKNSTSKQWEAIKRSPLPVFQARTQQAKGLQIYPTQGQAIKKAIFKPHTKFLPLHQGIASINPPVPIGIKGGARQREVKSFRKIG